MRAMSPRDLALFLFLACLWGGSFLFVRMTVPEFGPLPVASLRLGIASLVLLPFMLARGGARWVRPHLGALTVTATFNSALPFALYAWAMVTLTAGYASILNAAAPLFGAIAGYLWWRERLTGAQIGGLVLGFGGVVLLAWNKLDFGVGGAGLAVLAATLGSLQYGAVSPYIKDRLGGVPALVTSSVSVGLASLMLAPLALLAWPARMPSPQAWLALAALGALCTGAGYALFYRLLARIGAARAITITFLTPVTGTLWGALFLDEPVTFEMLAGGAVILAGTALVTQVLRRAPSPAAATG